VLSEHEFLLNSDDVLLVFGVAVSKLLQDFNFDQPLLIESLLVSKDLQRNELLVFVVEALEDLAEAALAQSVRYFEPVSNVLAFLRNILILIVVESVILHAVGSSGWALGRLAFLNVNPVNGFIVQNLSLLILHQVLRIVDNDRPGVHRELQFSLLVVEGTVAGLLSDRTEAGRATLLVGRER